jgi:hypothetical protein
MEESSSWALVVAGKLRRMLSSSSGMAKTWAAVMFLIIFCCLSMIESMLSFEFIYSYAVTYAVVCMLCDLRLRLLQLVIRLGSSLAASMMGPSGFAPLTSCNTSGRPILYEDL